MKRIALVLGASFILSIVSATAMASTPNGGFRPRSFDGSYKVIGTGKLAFSACPYDPPPAPQSITAPNKFNITNGLYEGHLLSNISLLGRANITVKFAVGGLTYVEKDTFTHGLTDEAVVFVLGTYTATGAVGGCTVKGSGTIRGSRTAVAP